MPIFKIHHITKYEYDRPVKESMNEIRIYPYQCPEQETLIHDLVITGSPDVQVFFDYWGNKTGIFNLMQPHKELIIESKLMVRTTSAAEIGFNFDGTLAELRTEMKGKLKMIELAKAENIKEQSRIEEIVTIILEKDDFVASIVGRCSSYIYEFFNYIKGITTIETTVDEILLHHAGVCQDFAHLMLQILRTIGIPSRYVSGYICPNKNGMRGEGATHAWVEVWLPGYGWAGIDPTNSVWVTNNHVKLAVGSNFNDCSPIKGTFKGPAVQQLSVFVSVGYEDGNMFEEMNNVKMEELPVTPVELITENNFAGQQQQ